MQAHVRKPKDGVVAYLEREFGKLRMSREELLDAPLLLLRGYTLDMTCFSGCTKPGSLPLPRMAASCGRGLQLRRAIVRLRCKACRGPPAAV